MTKFIVNMIDVNSGEVIESMDEKFDTYEEADEYSLVCGSNYSTGAEVLELAGRDFNDPNDVDFIVEEIDE